MTVQCKLARNMPQALAAAAQALRLGDGRLLGLIRHEGATVAGAKPERCPCAAQETAARLLVALRYIERPNVLKDSPLAETRWVR